MKKVAVVDYGMGNLRSVTQAVVHVAAGSGVEVVWARTPQEVMDAERVVLPGQGGMRDCMRELHESGMAPWPGNTTRSAARTSSGREVITTW